MWHRSPRSADSAIIESDNPALRRDAVDNTGIPVIEYRHQMVQKDHRYTGVGAKRPIGKRCSVHIKGTGRHIFPIHMPCLTYCGHRAVTGRSPGYRGDPHLLCNHVRDLRVGWIVCGCSVTIKLISTYYQFTTKSLSKQYEHKKKLRYPMPNRAQHGDCW